MTSCLLRLEGLPDVLYAYAFPRWKWPVVRQCFSPRRIQFIEALDQLPGGAWLLMWGAAAVPPSIGATVHVLRMEDGFLRSVGLGAELVRPLSWVVDSRGIYYDATAPSDLEVILTSQTFDAKICARAARLRERIVDSRLTKYNVGGNQWQRPAHAKHVVLVPGQVESDASLAFGAPGERTNMGLLRAVRAENPEAYIIYKPHPDVTARLRKEGVNDASALQWCDAVVCDVAMGDLLPQVDAVHVLTSLSGFEALMYGKEVTCHGQPFYAGWGLTSDRIPHPRRGRQLSLDALVAATLIEYPLYLSRDGKRRMTPEEAVESLQDWRATRGTKLRWWQPVVRVFLRWVIGVR